MDQAKNVLARLLRRAVELREEIKNNQDLSDFFVWKFGGQASGLEEAARIIALEFGLPVEGIPPVVEKGKEDS